MKEGGLRVAGCGTMYYSLPAGLGEDVYILSSEPYGAAIAYFPDFAMQCFKATERAGFKTDFCSYTRAYWGAMLLDKFVLPDGTIHDGWAKPHFGYTSSLAPCNAKWGQYVAEFKDVPFYSLDGPEFFPGDEVKDNVINYLTQQGMEAIEWMEKVSGRKFNDSYSLKLFIMNAALFASGRKYAPIIKQFRLL